MNFIKLRQSLGDRTLFSVLDIKKLDPLFHRRRLNEWQDKGYIRKIVKGYYIFSDLKIDESILFEIANRIYPPSYVSLETAFAYYGLIPESVYGVTSVSTRRTYRFNTPVAKFSYKTLRPRLYFGYDIIRHGDKSFRIASIEKAILDYLYINPGIRSGDDFESPRFNKDAFAAQANRKKFNAFLKNFDRKALAERAGSFLEFMKNA